MNYKALDDQVEDLYTVLKEAMEAAETTDNPGEKFYQILVDGGLLDEGETPTDNPTSDYYAVCFAYCCLEGLVG